MADHLKSHRYNTKTPRKGIVLIFNNVDFQSAGLPTRTGGNKDEENMRKLFRVMGFEAEDVNVRRDVTVREMRQELLRVSKLDHSDYSCFVCLVLSHGEDGYVYGTDGKLPVSDITKQFQKRACPSLNGKPKLFFIQACRGTKFDEGVDYVDSINLEQPTEDSGFATPEFEPDFLIAYSVVQGYFSFRNNGNGSYFIQAIDAIFSKFWGDYDLQKLMTRVHYIMAERFESVSSNENMLRKKQMPCLVSTLTKDFFF